MSNFSNWELNHEFVPQVGILLPNGNSDPKDFLIFKKGAIQLGSSGISNQIIYSSLKHSRRDIEKIQKSTICICIR